MKAGIFKTTDGTLLYVGKDQYVRASLGAKSLDGYKVVYSKARDAVSIVAAMTNGHRVANVRNGFNRSAFDLLHDIANKIENPDVLDLHGGVMRYEAEEANDDDFSLNVDGNDSVRETVREGTLVPPADAPEGDPVDLDPELAAYHGEADDSDREAVNLLPDDVSPAQSLHEFVAERMHRIDAGGAAPPVVVDTPEKVEKTVAETLMRKEETRDKVMRGCPWMFDLVEKPTDISADGFREIRAMQEELKADVIRKMTVPAELGMPYGAGKSGPTPVSEYAANMFARLDAQREIERVANGSADENGFDIGGALSATGTVTVEVTLSPQMEQQFRQALEAGKAMHEQMVNDFLTDRIEFVPGVSDEVLWHNDEERERLARERLARGEFRLCHAAAARKHKKKRDRHVWWHPVFGCYAWKKVEVAA